METYLELNRIKNKMKDPPSTQELNSFFDGAKSKLDKDQKINLIEVVKKHSEDIIEFIKLSLNE